MVFSSAACCAQSGIGSASLSQGRCPGDRCSGDTADDTTGKSGAPGDQTPLIVALAIDGSEVQSVDAR